MLQSFDSEVSDSKMLALQKTAETFCILAKFGEAQDTIREADMMVNELTIANEANKLEIKRMKKERVVLVNERDVLIKQVQSLQSSNNQKDWCHENLVKQFESDFISMKELVEELADTVSLAHSTSKEDFISVSSDFHSLKSQLHDSTKLMQSSVEDIWSEIIIKDCAVSVLHLCHMGILVETVNGLNAENGLLHHGLSEYQEEMFLVDLSAKDFNLLVLASELEQMASQKDMLAKEQICLCAVLDELKQEFVLLRIDAELKKRILLDSEVEVMLLSKLQNELRTKNEELTRVRSIEEENDLWRSEVRKSKTEYCFILQELEEKKSEIESALRGKEVLESENHRLQDDIFSLQNTVSNLQNVLDTANVELNRLQLSESELKDALTSTVQDFKDHVHEVETLKVENDLLSNELISLERNKAESLRSLSLKIKKCVHSVDNVDTTCSRIFDVLNEESIALENIFEGMHENEERASKIIEDFESSENLSKELISENLSLRAELERKHDVLEGLSFDLRLLQESASNSQDQNDEIVELLASLEALEYQLSVKSNELDESVGKGRILEAQLWEKIDIISTLEMNVKSLSKTNLELTGNITNALKEKVSVEEELTLRRKCNESLEQELLEMSTALEQMNNFVISLKTDLNSVTCERDDIRAELLTLKEELQIAQALAEENEAIAIDARQVHSIIKVYF